MNKLGVEMARTMYKTVIKDLVLTRLNDVDIVTYSHSNYWATNQMHAGRKETLLSGLSTSSVDQPQILTLQQH